MKTAIKQPSVRDMRITLNVLSALGIPVPEGILIELSERIRTKEEQRRTRRISRMSEEDLIRYQSRSRTSLRVVLSDGRLLQGRTNDTTFVMALQEVGAQRIQSAPYRLGRKPLFVFDATASRVRYKNYLIIAPGVLVWSKTTAAQKQQILEHFDQTYQLGWTISLC